MPARTSSRGRHDSRTRARSVQKARGKTRPLEEQGIRELRDLARRMDIHGRSRMSKKQLVKAIARER